MANDRPRNHPAFTDPGYPELLLRALRALGQPAGDELHHASPRELLDWGIEHWDAAQIPRTLTLAEAQLR